MVVRWMWKDPIVAGKIRGMSTVVRRALNLPIAVVKVRGGAMGEEMVLKREIDGGLYRFGGNVRAGKGTKIWEVATTKRSKRTFNYILNKTLKTFQFKLQNSENVSKKDRSNAFR